MKDSPCDQVCKVKLNVIQALYYFCYDVKSLWYEQAAKNILITNVCRVFKYDNWFNFQVFIMTCKHSNNMPSILVMFSSSEFSKYFMYRLVCGCNSETSLL